MAVSESDGGQRVRPAKNVGETGDGYVPLRVNPATGALLTEVPPGSAGTSTDVTDRAARLLGVVTSTQLANAIAGIGVAAKSLADVVGAIQATQPRSVSGAVTVANPTANPETGLAKDATLELVRVQAAAVNANTDTIEPLLTTIRDEQIRRTDPLASGTAFVGYTGNFEDNASKQGRYRFAGAKVATSVASPNATITLSNPAASGVDLIVTRYQVEVDASAEVVLVMDASSTGVISANLNPNERTSIANPGVVRAGAGVITGGTTASVIRRATTSSPVAVGPFRFRIIPGGSITVQFVGPGATNTVWFNIGWFVVDAGADLA